MLFIYLLIFFLFIFFIFLGQFIYLFIRAIYFDITRVLLMYMVVLKRTGGLAPKRDLG